MNNENNRKEKKRLIVLLLTFLIIAVACIVPVFVNGFSGKTKEAVSLSELIEGKAEIEGQYVQFEFDALPIMVLLGVFLLVMAFGYVVPGLIRLHKAESGIQNR